jgi:hypothetical protein
MSGWLRRCRAALGVGADRSDLWVAGALGWLVYLGWLPLILAISPPDANAIESFGVSMYLSQDFPLNVLLLAAGLVAGFAALCLIGAMAGVGLQRLATRPRGPISEAGSTLSAFTIVLVSSLPLVAALVVVAIGIINVAPAEYLSSDLATPVLLRIGLRVIPQLLLALLVLVLVQSVAAVALRVAFSRPGRPAVSALGEAIREVRGHPLSLLGTSLVSALLDGLVLGVTVWLLRALWTPIGTRLGDGLLRHPETLLLLLGFVGIWLGLLLAAGALHVAVSALWAAQLGRDWEASPASGQAGRLAGSETGGPH